MMNQNQEERSKLAITSIVIAIIGVLILLNNSQSINSQEIGLTLIFISALLMSGNFVYRRLVSVAADVWAVGSIIVWIGFVVFSFPVIAFAWNLMDPKSYLILFTSGLILMIIGYTTEFFDLNQRFIIFGRKFKIRTLELIEDIKKRLFSSPWIFTIFIASTILVFTFILQDLFNDTASTLSISILQLRLGLGMVIVASLGIELRSYLFFYLQSLYNFFVIIFRAIGRRITKIPDLLRTLFRNLKLTFSKIIKRINGILISATANIYFLSFVFSIIVGALGLIKDDLELQAFGLLFFITGLTILIYQKPELVVEGVSRIQQNSYKRALNVTKRFRKPQPFPCPNCSTIISHKTHRCYNCGYNFTSCNVCKIAIQPYEFVLKCDNCQAFGHYDHAVKWTSIKPFCPNCREQWKPSKQGQNMEYLVKVKDTQV